MQVPELGLELRESQSELQMTSSVNASPVKSESAAKQGNLLSLKEVAAEKAVSRKFDEASENAEESKNENGADGSQDVVSDADALKSFTRGMIRLSACAT